MTEKKHGSDIRIGIDIGSTTIKIVAADENGTILYSDYRRHKSHTQEVMAELLREFSMATGITSARMRMTGSGSINLSSALGVGFVQEVVAVAEALKSKAPQTDVAIELGGEDAKIIYFTGGLEERMNGVCAGGTGAFIDQMASRAFMDAPSAANRCEPSGHIAVSSVRWSVRTNAARS